MFFKCSVFVSIFCVDEIKARLVLLTVLCSKSSTSFFFTFLLCFSIFSNIVKILSRSNVDILLFFLVREEIKVRGKYYLLLKNIIHCVTVISTALRNEVGWKCKNLFSISYLKTCYSLLHSVFLRIMDFI